MSGLRPFRTIPKDLLEWERWMRAQDGVFGALETTIINNNTTTEAKTLWVPRTFDGDRTLASDDNEYLLVSTSATAVTVTVDPGVLEKGAQVTLLQYGAGTVTFAAGTGTTIRTPTGLAINEQYGSATLIQFDANEWFMAGRIA